VAWGTGDGYVFLVSSAESNPDSYLPLQSGQGQIITTSIDSTSAYWTDGSNM
jgi:hypothetical protein